MHVSDHLVLGALLLVEVHTSHLFPLRTCPPLETLPSLDKEEVWRTPLQLVLFMEVLGTIISTSLVTSLIFYININCLEF